jgi:hypothetical protein
MKAALADLKKGPLLRQRHGWANNQLRGHSTRVVEALVARGLAETPPDVPRGFGKPIRDWKERGAVSVTAAGLKETT